MARESAPISPRKETSSGKEQSNPFGPWMLVQRPMRRKEIILSKQNGSLAIGGTNNNNIYYIGKGRFDAVVEEEDGDVVAAPYLEPEMKLHALVESADLRRDKKEVGQPQVNKPISTPKNLRVRNSTGRRNPQSNCGKMNLGQPIEKPNRAKHKQDSGPGRIVKENEASSSNKVQTVPPIYKGSKEYKASMKEKEKEALQLMKIYEKTKGHVLNDFATQTYLPGKETIYFYQQVASSSGTSIMLPKPPYPMLVTSSCMEIEETLVSQPVKENVEDIQDPWTTFNGNLLDLALGPIEEEDKDKYLVDFVTPSGCWDVHYMSVDDRKVFQRIWKWQGPQRIRVLLWKIVNEAFLTNHNRRRRNLTLDGICKLRNKVEETTLHVFRDCDHTQVVWMNLIHRTHHLMFFQQNLQEWLDHNLSNINNNQAKSSWDILFGCTCEILWQRRNKLIFEDEQFNLSSTMKMIWSKFREIQNTTMYHHSLPLQMKGRMAISIQ
ncbi:hypothetical protein RIF29_28447 [Crotalaria pallida]|uniref:Reverse transcriptase zinc-binding domain-containing protein n=1 Tax=Crotalaria pallida TaxID=3830 RepID=A0AAN9EHY9_CROPI